MAGAQRRVGVCVVLGATLAPGRALATPLRHELGFAAEGVAWFGSEYADALQAFDRDPVPIGPALSVRYLRPLGSVVLLGVRGGWSYRHASVDVGAASTRNPVGPVGMHLGDAGAVLRLMTVSTAAGQRPLRVVLPAGTAVSLPFVHVALSDGTELTLNARCTAGATLWLDGDSMWDGRTPLQLSAPQGWHRVVRTLTSPTTVRASPGEVVRGQHAYALRLRVSGRGECAVDRVEHRVLARVCQRWSPTLEQCLRVGGWDAGNWGDDDVPQARDAGTE